MAFSGFHLHLNGYSGSITITEGSDSAAVTPKATDSAWRIASALATAATSACSSTYSFSVNDAGLLTISSTGTFNVAMSSAIQSRFNFSASSYSSVSSVTSTTAPDGSFHPYDDGDGVLFTRDLRGPSSQGFETYEGGMWLNTPGTNLRFPILSVSCLRAKVVEFMAITQDLGTPSRVDVLESGAVTQCSLGTITIREVDPIEGWTQISLEVVK